MVREAPLDSRGRRIYEIDAMISDAKQAAKMKREHLRRWVRGRKIRFVSLDAALGWKGKKPR